MERKELEEIRHKQLPTNTRYHPQMELGFYVCIADGIDCNKELMFKTNSYMAGHWHEISADNKLGCGDGSYDLVKEVRGLSESDSVPKDKFRFMVSALSYQIQRVTGNMRWDATMLNDFAFLAGPFESRSEARDNAKPVFEMRYNHDGKK